MLNTTGILGRLRPAWQWWSALSLDAPLICWIWAHTLSHAHHSPFPPSHQAVLLLSIWLGYSADRWFDHRRLSPHASAHSLHLRHQLPGRLPRLLPLLWVSLLLSNIAIATTHLPPRLIQQGLLLMALSLLYTAYSLYHHRHPSGWPLKESATALLLSLAITLLSQQHNPIALLAITSLFLLNCLLLKQHDHHHQARHKIALTLTLILLILSILTLYYQHNTILALCITLCTTTLLLLHQKQKQIPHFDRAYYDLALCLPMLTWVMG